MHRVPLHELRTHVRQAAKRACSHQVGSEKTVNLQMGTKQRCLYIVAPEVKIYTIPQPSSFVGQASSIQQKKLSVVCLSEWDKSEDTLKWNLWSHGTGGKFGCF